MLGENIKFFRLSENINQVEFAKILGVTKQCVSNWENDNVVPSIEMLCRISDFFNVSTDFLLGRVEERTLNASGLSEDQIAHITYLIDSFSKLNELNK